MDTIEQLEKRLWGAADLLRANSNLNSQAAKGPRPAPAQAHKRGDRGVSGERLRECASRFGQIGT
jgi:hypothetical protein